MKYYSLIPLIALSQAEEDGFYMHMFLNDMEGHFDPGTSFD